MKGKTSGDNSENLSDFGFAKIIRFQQNLDSDSNSVTSLILVTPKSSAQMAEPIKILLDT